MSDERFEPQDDNFSNIDPEYANYAVDTDKPYEQELPEVDPNLPLQFADGSVPVEREEAEEKNEEKEDESKEDSKPSAPAVAPATSPAKPVVK